MTHDNKLVLIVDDTPTNVGVISGVLKGAYRTKVATNGEKALVLATAAEKPDLILLDVMMPGMDGYEVCRRLKANPVTRDIPVIFLTAKTDALDEENGFEVGAVDYIHKPFSGPIVLARVKTQLALQAALGEAREARNQADELLHALLPKKAADEIRARKQAVREVLPWVNLAHGNARELMEFADAADLDTALRRVAEWGAEAVIVHLGTQGAGWFHDGELLIEPPVPAQTQVNATGTGDVLSVCTMLLHHLTEVPMSERLRLANGIVSQFIEGKRQLIPVLAD